MKRALALFIGITFVTASCVSNASLWGQYATPTALPGTAPTSSPVPPVFISATPAAFEPILEADATVVAPSATTSAQVFVTQDIATSTIENVPVNMTNVSTLLYYTQSGDWLPAVAKRFGVDVSEIASPKVLPENGLLDVGTLLLIPDRRDESITYTPALQLLPDNEVVFSATALDFDISTYVKDAGGYLSAYREYLGSTGWTTGAGVIERTAYENSVNPRLLLALLDYEARWVRSTPENKFRTDYPFGHENFRNKGLFMQLAWGVSKLSIGYYGWRTGTLTEIDFSDGTKLKLDPNLNAGTVALMYFFSRSHSLNDWWRIMDNTSGFASYYQNMFGDPWARADHLGSQFPPSLSQPEMVLPFETNSPWTFTGGPHAAWEHDGPLAALDFAPASDKTGCDVAPQWVLAAAAGLVVRSGPGLVVVDMDGDGSEQTGWNILYMHIANKDRVSKGQWVEVNDRIGHASCEGGFSTGTHLHFARKFNGEWMIADGPVPFVLSGWTALAGDKPYHGKLVKGDKVIIADVNSQLQALIYRQDDGE